MGPLESLTRRRLMRGAMAGSAVMVGLPILECALNVNGVAFADGAPLPTRFGTWFWGLGFNPGRYEPKKTGSLLDQPLGPELAALEPIKDKINVYSMFKVFLDNRPNTPHQIGWQAQLMGRVPAVGEQSKLPTIDTLIADHIGATTRFRSIEVSCGGSARTSMSYRSGGVQQTSEVSPTQLYARIFGQGFRDPNGADFKPDPAVMARQSVLSGVTEHRQALMRHLGSTDRARLDEYFTSLRQLEQQLLLQLERPAPLEACKIGNLPAEAELSDEVDVTLRTNKLMSGLLAHALACDQTRVVNVALTGAGSSLRLPGDATTYHSYTHIESKDAQLGYQKKVSYFATRCMEGFAEFVQTLASVKEGDGTLLDRMLVLATTDTGYANTHSMENIPVLTAGRAGGAMKTGLHVTALADPATRIGLTAMQAMRLPVSSFGHDSNQTTKAIGEVLT